MRFLKPETLVTFESLEKLLCQQAIETGMTCEEMYAELVHQLRFNLSAITAMHNEQEKLSAFNSYANSVIVLTCFQRPMAIESRQLVIWFGKIGDVHAQLSPIALEKALQSLLTRVLQYKDMFEPMPEVIDEDAGHARLGWAATCLMVSLLLNAFFILVLTGPQCH